MIKEAICLDITDPSTSPIFASPEPPEASRTPLCRSVCRPAHGGGDVDRRFAGDIALSPQLSSLSGR
jgi:hypothetical protein